MRPERRAEDAPLGRALADRAEDYLEHLLGRPTRRSPGEWRYRRKGSLACSLRGERRGLYFDHEAGDGGDLVKLTAIVRGLTIADACRESARWLGRPLHTSSPLAGEGGCASPQASADGRGDSVARESSEALSPLPSRREQWLASIHLPPQGGKLWRSCVSARGTLAEQYLHARGLKLPPCDDIRFHPALLHVPSNTRWPALVALMRDVVTNEPSGLHRTYLARDGTGKAPVEPQKMMLGRARGACVKLVPDDEVLEGIALAEGIESALAAQAIGYTRIWATLSAGALAAFPVLGGIEALTIFADHDGAGLKAARECAARWSEAGRDVFICTRTTPGDDWAD